VGWVNSSSFETVLFISAGAIVRASPAEGVARVALGRGLDVTPSYVRGRVLSGTGWAPRGEH
jgi:hypothetical protein